MKVVRAFVQSIEVALAMVKEAVGTFVLSPEAVQVAASGLEVDKPVVGEC